MWSTSIKQTNTLIAVLQFFSIHVSPSSHLISQERKRYEGEITIKRLSAAVSLIIYRFYACISLIWFLLLEKKGLIDHLKKVYTELLFFYYSFDRKLYMWVVLFFWLNWGIYMHIILNIDYNVLLFHVNLVMNNVSTIVA